FAQFVSCAADRGSLKGDRFARDPLAAWWCQFRISPDDADTIASRESEHLRNDVSTRRIMIRSAVRQSVSHRHVSVGSDSNLCAEGNDISSELFETLLEINLSLAIAHVPGMVLRHTQTDPSAESSRAATGFRVSAFPSDRFRAFLQNFNGSEGIVR